MSDDERRKHFRVKLDAKVAIGPFRMRLEDDAGFAFRMRHADAVDSLLTVRHEAEPVLAVAVDRGVEYMVTLLDLVVGQLDGRTYEDHEVSVHLDNREISLSEGGIGTVGTPPCDVGGEVPLVLIAIDHPSRRPIAANVRLVRTTQVEDDTYLGFEFLDLGREARQHLIEMVFRTQRRLLREAREM